jgi:hypothetical protein
MFELADFLIGIYKVEDCTRSLTIGNSDKQRILCIGEKEGEKENQAENSFDMLKATEKERPNLSNGEMLSQVVTP